MAIKRGILFCALLLVGGLLLTRPPRVRHAPPRLTPGQVIGRKPAVTLRSERPFQEVRVPFTIDRGWIMVPATVCGRPVRCLLDTGSLRVFDWPTSLRLPARPVGLAYPRLAPYRGARPRPAAWFVLPRIDIGGYGLRGCPALAHAADPTDDPGLAVPTLGCAAFSDVVLTIDYRRRELIVRSPDYDVTRDAAELARFPRHSLAALVWGERVTTVWDERGVTPVGVPSVRGSVAGHPVQVAIDTGSCHTGLALASEPLIAALVRAGRTPRLVRPCRQCATLAVLPSVPWSVGGLAGRGAVLLRPGFMGKDAAFIGTDFLKDHRVTLDFPRRRVLLEDDT